MENIGGLPVGLAAHLREAVVSLGPDGNIEWANDATFRLLRIEPDRLLGTSALDRVHPDEVARALDGIAFSTSAPDRTAVVPFRIRGGDDSWIDVELKSSVVAGDDGDHLVLILRDAAPRRAVAEALAHVAAGKPVDETAPWLARVIESRWPGVVSAVLLDDVDGRRLIGAENWPAALVTAVLDDATGPAIWRDAINSCELRVIGTADLPEAVREVANGAGFTTFAVAPVSDPAGGRAALVAWFDLAEAAHMEFAHASGELIELLTLALERRHHLSELDHAARHDLLTGLLNRSGFVELVDHMTLDDGAGSDASRAALLYIDLDGFKPVNDRFGHAVGDEVLRVVGDRLASRAGAFAVARIGGDEFVVLGTGAGDIEAEATELAQAIVGDLGAPIVITDDAGVTIEVTIGASVGVAITGSGHDDVQRLLERADGAMYAVKAGGGRSWSARLP